MGRGYLEMLVELFDPVEDLYRVGLGNLDVGMRLRGRFPSKRTEMESALY